ncbi:MAG: EamA family transporter [Thermoplasmata archaeon]
MHSRSWYIGIVIFSAFIVAVESVSVEGALNIVLLDVFIVTGIPSIIGGLILTVVQRDSTIEFTRRLRKKEWAFLVALSTAAAFGAYFWFDAVGEIGAGKEAILGGGSSEVLFVVILSAIFLSERLSKWEAFGGVLVLVGVFLVLVRADSFSLSVGKGEMEAILSSFLLASSAVMTAKLLRTYEVAPVSALELIISGIIILAIGFALGTSLNIDVIGWLILMALGVFPAIGILTYFHGLQGIGASITSILFALNGIMTLVVQLAIVIVFPDSLMVPQNLLLAFIGGIIAFIGVYLLNKKAPDKQAYHVPQKVI